MYARCGIDKNTSIILKIHKPRQDAQEYTPWARTEHDCGSLRAVPSLVRRSGYTPRLPMYVQ